MALRECIISLSTNQKEIFVAVTNRGDRHLQNHQWWFSTEPQGFLLQPVNKNKGRDGKEGRENLHVSPLK